MQMITAIEDLDQGQLLDHADGVARLQRECEAQVLRIAVQHAVINNPDTLDPDLTKLPGREKARRYGGVGTPEVAEFCCASLAARLGITSWAAASLIADGLDITIRLPKIWRRVEAFEVKVSYARYVARRTRDLTVEQAAYVDAAVAESADGRVPWTRFEELVAGAIAGSDPEAAAERERIQAERQFANPTRSTEDGMRGFYVRAPFHVIARLDATITWIADMLAALGDTDPVDHRRVKSIAILANPQRAVELVTAFQAWRERPSDPDLVTSSPEPTPETSQRPPGSTGPKPTIDWEKVFPRVTVHVHTYRASCGCDEPASGIVRTEGGGPVTHEWVRHWLGAHARFTIRPVLDIEGQAPVDAYEIPDRHRRAVHLITPADTFPFGSCTSRRQQIDHTVAYHHRADDSGTDDGGAAVSPGQSRIGNYGPMTSFHHRIKTFGGWQVRQPFPGLYLWRDPHGVFYLVDHTGTRRIVSDQDPPEPRRQPASPAEVHIGRGVFELVA